MALCFRCGKNNPKEPCGRSDCPYLLLFRNVKQLVVEGKEEYSGKSPSIFVGRKGYPNVYAGILGSEHADEKTDNPLLWAKENYKIPDVLSLRSSLINSRFTVHVKSFDQRFLDVTREIALAGKPVEVEMKLDKKPKYTIHLSDSNAPFGPAVGLTKATITENPSVPIAVERATGDTDLRAGEALVELYKKNIDEHSLTKLISAGTLGKSLQRKLVPTRWSITAVDDTVGKNLIKQIKEHSVSDYLAYFGGYLGNYYIILFFPEVWSYELFESYCPREGGAMLETMTDYEPYDGRTNYAESTVGGYYAARLAILDKLALMKRQASVIAIRLITEEYYAPLGVWVVRSATRNALMSNPVRFGTKEEIINYAIMLAKSRFSYSLEPIFNNSKLLFNINNQKKLSSFY